MKTKLPSHRLMRPYEVELHYKRPLFSSMKSICCAEDANLILRSYVDEKKMDMKEFFYVIFLSRANHVLGISTINCGNISGVCVNIREILVLTLLLHAPQIIVAHNHPSGKLTPSKNDEKITEKLQQGLSLFDAQLLDHLILTSEDFYSFADQGAL